MLCTSHLLLKAFVQVRETERGGDRERETLVEVSWMSTNGITCFSLQTIRNNNIGVIFNTCCGYVCCKIMLPAERYCSTKCCCQVYACIYTSSPCTFRTQFKICSNHLLVRHLLIKELRLPCHSSPLRRP